MALSIFEDDPLGTQPNDPNTVKRFAAKKLKTGRVTPDDQSGDQYSQLSSTMPGKPASAAKEPLDPDKRDAIKRRMRKQTVS